VSAPAFSLLRVRAMVARYSYLLRSSLPRLLEMAYWPMMQMVTWGFMQNYLAKTSDSAGVVAGALIGAVLLWDILIRAQQGFSFSFIEEMWSRNLANLLMSPLRTSEFIAALMAMSLIRLAIGMAPVIAMAMVFFGFNLFSLGASFTGFFLVLIFFAWSVGLFVSGVLLRFGLGAENLVWSVIFIVQPLGCVYYPVSVMPPWLQHVSWMLPPTYAFEGLRSVLLDHAPRYDLMARGLGLDALLFAGACVAFSHFLAGARRVGTLLQTGE
jgi:ABC-2 type transport system permease protein